MRIFSPLISGSFLWVLFLCAGSASPAEPGKPETKPGGELFLYAKNPSDGSAVPGGGQGKMTYAAAGPAFEFRFSGSGLRPGAGYTLIYFPDPWPGEGLVCLASGTADPRGNLSMKGSAPLVRLPAPYDANYPAGAKIRLVLSEDIDPGGGRPIARKRMRRWSPDQYLLGDRPLRLSLPRAGCRGPAQKSGAFPRRRILSGGIDRQYNLFVPSAYAPGRPTPLVFSFHGFGADPESQDWLSGLPRLAEEAGFILVTPKGTGSEEILGWNAGECCGQAALENVDDVAFTSEMIDQVGAEYCLDESRIYATGMSNGAFLSYRLACDLSHRIAAIAPVAGVTVADPCLPARPVPVVAFHGTADLVVWYGGGIFESVPRTIARWSVRNGCPRETETVYRKGNARCESYRNCRKGATVELCTVSGGGHAWPGGGDLSSVPPYTFGLEGKTTRDLDASRAMWEFFQKHPMP